MSIEILVNVAPRETRAALLDNGALQEVFIERASRRGLVSNLYKGRVTRVLPGMQAAFLETRMTTRARPKPTSARWCARVMSCWCRW
jgi:Ribonuclease G/E